MEQNSNVAGTEVAKTAAQIISILSCHYWKLQSPSPNLKKLGLPSFQLDLLMAAIEDCTDPDVSLSSISDGHTTHSNGYADAGTASSAHLAILDRFRDLPSLMAGKLDRPDSAQDVFATLAAVDALYKCSIMSYASDDTGTIWTGMASWLERLSDRFKQMLKRRNPAALIVVAHWSLLVHRAAHYYWFLEGLATKLLQQVLSEFPADGAGFNLAKGVEAWMPQSPV